MKKPAQVKQEQAKPAPKQKMTAEDCKRIGLDPSVYGLKAE